jgi:hypothetical protein
MTSIQMVRGDVFDFYYTIRDSSGEIVDISQGTYFVLKMKKVGLPLISISGTRGNPLLGEVVFHMDGTIPVGSYKAQIRFGDCVLRVTAIVGRIHVIEDLE